MREKRMINFLTGLLFTLVFCLNSGAFGYLSSEQTCLPSEVVFIDPSVLNAEKIVSQLPRGAEVVRLSPGMDGVAQISAHLAKKRGLSAIHIISHGASGYMMLCGKRIGLDALKSHGKTLSALKDSLVLNGDIMLYACHLAEGLAGEKWVETLAHITGAHVAASTNLTGKGSDWRLEYACGAVTSEPLNIQKYPHHLATRVVTNNSDSGDGSLRAQIDAAIDGDVITFANDYTITTDTQLLISV